MNIFFQNYNAVLGLTSLQLANAIVFLCSSTITFGTAIVFATASEHSGDWVQRHRNTFIVITFAATYAAFMASSMTTSFLLHDEKIPDQYYWGVFKGACYWSVGVAVILWVLLSLLSKRATGPGKES